VNPSHRMEHTRILAGWSTHRQKADIIAKLLVLTGAVTAKGSSARK